MMINSLVIEITRRCNMQCMHCLRGEAQGLSFNPEILDEFLRINRVEYIGDIVFTGGEPSLEGDKINQCIDVLAANKVDVSNFYIATNGKNPGEKAGRNFIVALAELYRFCSDNQISAVEISQTEFHDAERGFDNEWVEQIKAFRFVGLKHRPKEYDWIISSGRAYVNGFGARTVEPYVLFENGDVVDGDVYLNCERLVVPGCDFSYEDQLEWGIPVCVGVEALKRFEQCIEN